MLQVERTGLVGISAPRQNGTDGRKKDEMRFKRLQEFPWPARPCPTP